MATVRSLNDLIVFENSQGVRARGNLVKVTRSTLIVEVYNPYSIVQLSEVLHGVEIRSNERMVYRGRAVVSGLVNTGLMVIVSASLLDPWSELIGLAGDSETIDAEVAEFVAGWRSDQRIRPAYQLSVVRLRSFLTTMNRWLEHLDFDENRISDRGMMPDEDLFSDLAEPLVPTLLELLQDFEVQAGAIAEEERTTHIRYAQDDLHPLLMRAPFVHRAYHKPLGYAGDYEMVNMMLRDSREGPTVYAQLINMLYLKTGPAQAHRNRLDILVDWIHERAQALRAASPGHRPRILSVGCGPAIELQRLIRRDPEFGACDVTLVDFSEETLSYTEGELKQAVQHSGVRPNLEFLHESVHGLLRQASTKGGDAPERYYDVIYCAGLFDYLSDRVCSRLIRLFYQWCRPGGEVMVTNVHPGNSSRHGMEHLLEWYLIYRDESGMEKLAKPYGDYRVFTDETGINVFLTIGKIAE